MSNLPREFSRLNVSRETEDRLNVFVALFQKWAKTINLVAPSTLAEVWSRHIVDSVQIYAQCPGPRVWADLGSGGGFPGIVTGILLAGVGDGWVHLVESNNKKAAFLRTAILETGARASVHAIRIEEAPAVIEHCDAISARALADLDLLMDFGLPWAERNPDLKFFLHKGRDYRREVEKAHGRWRFDLVKHASVVEPDSVVLEISKLSRKRE
ncbi:MULTISPECIES: 16S rRNA (guanine(527)-N(7))-methyltransferase RsmG [unclassified Shinella]|uniref:16S rRNA (guanine(527)-N(7))-methyltransferase RsmG n=1 Tax=unclassified Shinella TaxID=2643062 RepID=UPI00234E8CA5|nr:MULTISPECIES: 16S rRNA (guanine(527)-N(7))-methyltransferase RsmG [unclassified Shinella]MCO5154370.1 16S rRNA (guanine(527)-N(7))-methyltransferase RsmG [Shinella sp.]MDC7263981.1 16S rRNA (guanine(527)-N(7))-methyltransferase RsmG [Shinella sp. HY16]MDC7270877.1 16S rRNA (guanine(527)-N(7))-methyltransferase RsmG [Shinella sp. YZ44]